VVSSLEDNDIFAILNGVKFVRNLKDNKKIDEDRHIYELNSLVTNNKKYLVQEYMDIEECNKDRKEFQNLVNSSISDNQIPKLCGRFSDGK
jgi:superfamily II RNA helicase